MKDEILAYISKYQNVTFAELSKNIGGFDGGSYCLPAPDSLGDTILWSDMSEEGSRAIQDLMNEKRIEAAPCGPLPYMTDGVMLKLPLATRARKYKKLHWLPVTFKTV